ncbi:hypothetical protein GOODEAATRI_023378, partial [Goodea atripinnis]
EAVQAAASQFQLGPYRNRCSSLTCRGQNFACMCAGSVWVSLSASFTFTSHVKRGVRGHVTCAAAEGSQSQHSCPLPSFLTHPLCFPSSLPPLPSQYSAQTRSQSTRCTLQRSHGPGCAPVTCTRCCSSSASLDLSNQLRGLHRPQQPQRLGASLLCKQEQLTAVGADNTMGVLHGAQVEGHHQDIDPAVLLGGVEGEVG